MVDRPDTWMPLYVADYLKDTRHLSTTEHGAYLLLILHAWTHEGLIPGDEKRVARIAGLTPKEWKYSRDVLLEFFIKKSDGFRHKRIEKERARASALTEQRREAGRASAASRAARKTGDEGNERYNERSTSVATESPTAAQRNGRPSHSTEERTPSPQAIPDDVRAVLEAGNFSCPPPDLALLKRWYEAGATLEQDIIPAIRKLRATMTKAPFSLKYFDAAIREKLAEDERQIAHFRKVAARNADSQAAAGGG